ncbi:HNH endonuclease signature motif containing protein [Streptomyces sp. NPDC048191]|uniref:HNH endonuclease n=1 Tax=Streptomyces sp. NPDC048191 TaxID=3155484 RepID=UPI003408A049
MVCEEPPGRSGRLLKQHHHRRRRSQCRQGLKLVFLKSRRRQHHRTWTWLCVLEANDGCCVYCGGPSQTMDHVIPFSDGGADDISNLVPVCHSCNLSKGDKTPAELMMGWDLRSRWSGNGIAQKSDLGGKSLREMYLSVHEEVLKLFDDLDTVAAEIADPKRQSWFLWATPWNYPYDLGVSWYRACYAEKIAMAKAEGWPDTRPEWLKRTSA